MEQEEVTRERVRRRKPRGESTLEEKPSVPDSDGQNNHDHAPAEPREDKKDKKDDNNETQDSDINEEKPTQRPLRDNDRKSTQNEETLEREKLKERERELELGPLKTLEPIRSDPIIKLKQRHKNIERLAAESLPEVHFIGKLLFGENIACDETEGVCCRYVASLHTLLSSLINCFGYCEYFKSGGRLIMDQAGTS